MELNGKEGFICLTCNWYAGFEGICCNGDSDYCAEFVPSFLTWCGLFKTKDDEPAV